MNSTSPAEYQVPPILNSLQKFVGFLRSQYSTDFSQFIVATTKSSSSSNSDGSVSSSSSNNDDDDNDDDSDSYKSGLIVLGAMVLSVLAFWLFILLILKAKGKSMGCASGRSFRAQLVQKTTEAATTTHNTESTTQTTSSRRRRATVRTAEEDEEEEGDDDSSSSSSASSSAGQIGKTRPAGAAGSFHDEEDNISVTSSCRSSDEDKKKPKSRHHQSARTSLPGSNNHNNNQHDEYSQTDDCSLLYKPTRRERRTQIAFFFLGLMTIACVPLILILSFAPIKTSTTTSQDLMLTVRELVYQVDSALDTIGTAASMSRVILETTPTNFSIVCPKVNASDAEEYLGLEDDLDDMILLLEKNYHALIDEVSENVTQVSSIVQRIDKNVVLVEEAYQEADKYIWIVPGLLLGLSALTAMAMFGVILSWKRQSNRRLQRILSYGVLPALLVASLACWILAVAAVITTAMSSDACTEGSSTGSPDATIHNILLDLGINTNSTIYDFASAYTGGCAVGEEPTQILVELEDQVQKLVDTIWRYLSSVDSVGRNNLREFCGGDSIDDFLNGARDLAKILTSVRRAIASLKSALQCSSVYPIYTQVVHESVCTDTASALAWGFLLFLAMGATTMGMISLRASWRHKIEQDPIYDEDDVAENMFVDEHEEYLAYISKYKHEWEEYEGVNVVPAPVVAENTAATLQQQQEQGEFSLASTSESEISTYSQTTSSSAASLTDDNGETPPHRRRLLDDEHGNEEESVFTDNDDGAESAISYEHRLFDPYLSSPDDVDQQSRGMSTDEISFLSLLEMQTITPTSQQLQQSTDPCGDTIVPTMIPASLLQQQRNFQRPGCEDVDGIPPPIAPPSKSRVGSSPKVKPALTISIDDPTTKPEKENGNKNDFIIDADEEKKDDDNDQVSQSSSPFCLERRAVMLEPSLLSTSEEPPSPVNRHRLELLLQSTSSGSADDNRTGGGSSSGWPTSFLPSTSDESSALPSSSFLPSTDESCKSTSPSSFREPSTFLQLSVYPSSVEATLGNSEAVIVSPNKNANVVSINNQKEKATSSSSLTVSGVAPPYTATTTTTNVGRNELDLNLPPAQIHMRRSPTKTKSNKLSPRTRTFDTSPKCPQSPASFGSLRCDNKVRAKQLAPTQSLRAAFLLKELDSFYEDLQSGESKNSSQTGGTSSSSSALNDLPKLVRSISDPKLSSSTRASSAAVHFFIDDDEPFSNVRKQVDHFSGPLNKNFPRNKTPTSTRQKHLTR